MKKGEKALYPLYKIEDDKEEFKDRGREKLRDGKIGRRREGEMERGRKGKKIE